MRRRQSFYSCIFEAIREPSYAIHCCESQNNTAENDPFYLENCVAWGGWHGFVPGDDDSYTYHNCASFEAYGKGWIQTASGSVDSVRRIHNCVVYSDVSGSDGFALNEGTNVWEMDSCATDDTTRLAPILLTILHRRHS